MNEPKRFANEGLAQISTALRNWVTNGILPCAGLALVTADGASYCRTEGFASVEQQDALSPASVVRITSMGKAIVVTAFFTMIEQGCFAVHDPVSRYLPEFAKLQVMAPDGRRDMARPLTLHHLLTHTSGITHDKFLPDHPAADAYRQMRPLATEQSLEELADMVAMLPLLFQPGTAFRYGYSIDILGRVMEAVAEQPLEQLLEQRIFAPLRMPDTGFQVTGDQLSRFASLYAERAAGGFHLLEDASNSRYRRAPRPPFGGHGMVSTLNDYRRFCEMLLRGGELDNVRILEPDTVELMMTERLSSEMYGAPGAGRCYLGVSVLDPVVASEPVAPGTLLMESVALTRAWVDPGTGLAGVFISQAYWVNSQDREYFPDYFPGLPDAPELRGRPWEPPVRKLAYQALV